MLTHSTDKSRSYLDEIKTQLLDKSREGLLIEFKMLSRDDRHNLMGFIRDNLTITADIFYGNSQKYQRINSSTIQAYLFRNRCLKNPKCCLEIEVNYCHDRTPFKITKKFLGVLFSDPLLLNKIRTLSIKNCEIELEAFQFLVTTLNALPYLSSFNCIASKVDDEMANFLWQHLRETPHPSLARVNLSRNSLTDASITELAELLRTSSTIAELYLGDQPNPYHHVGYSQLQITDIGLITLGQALQQNRVLRFLNLLGAGQLSNAGIDSFLKLINNNFSVTGFVYCSPPNVPFQYDPGYVQHKRQYDAMQRKINRITDRNYEKVMVLITAVNTENLAEMERLFNSGVSLYAAEKTTANGMLHLAVQDKREQVVRYLLSKGFNKNITNNAGEIAIDIAKKMQYPEIIALLEYDQIPPAPMIVDVAPPHKEPERRGKRKATELPADPRARIDSYFSGGKRSHQDTSAKTQVAAPVAVPLPEPHFPKDLPYFMALNGCVDFFAHHGTRLDLNARYENNQTLLHAAAKYGHHVLVRLFLTTYRIDVKVPDQEGRTPLHHACLFADRVDTVQTIRILINTNIPVDATDRYGITALYLLAGGFDQHINTITEADTLKASARMLIQHGAAVAHTVYDMELNVANFTVLHKAISRCNYYLVTAILSTKAFDFRMQDGNGDTVFHWAVRVADINILDRLLIEPSATDICKTIVNRDGKTAYVLARELMGQDGKYKVIVDLLEAHAVRIKPPINSGIYWINNFTLLYGTRYDHKDSKLCVIKLDDVHSALATSVQQLARGGGHQLAAALTFVVSNCAYTPENYRDHRRISITIRLDRNYSLHVTDAWHETETIGGRRRCPEMKARILQRIGAIPADKKCTLVDDYNTTDYPLSEKAIEELYAMPATPEKSFELSFHHSEQALLDFLENDSAIQEITDKLIQDPQFKHGCKVYAVILSLHSIQYICSNCEMGILGEQNSQQSIFLKKLAENLSRQGCKLSHHNALRMITCASSTYPGYGRARKNPDDHLNLEIDLRRYYGNLILQRDMSTTMPTATLFRSRH